MNNQQTFDIIKSNVKKLYYDTASDPNEVLEHYIDGSFSDLDYSMQNWTIWHPYIHLKRAARLCSIWATPDNPSYQKPDIPDFVCDIVRFFLKGGFVSHNWWMNDVGVPSQCGIIRLLMKPELEKKLTKAENDRLLKLFYGNPERPRLFDAKSSPSPNLLRPYASDGLHIIAQMVDSLIYFATTDPDADEAIKSIDEFVKAIDFEFSVIPWATGFGNPDYVWEEENIKTDYSYQQHEGCLLQNTYGAGLIEELGKFITLLEGTDFQLSPGTNQEICDLLTNGFAYMLYRNYSPMTVLGRNAASADMQSYKPEKFIHGCIKICKMIFNADNLARGKSELLGFSKRLKSPDKAPHFCGTRFYWHSDFLSHNRPDFQFTVHLASSRVKRPEAPLKKNIKGMYLGDGCCNIMTNGDEYEQLSPCLDWRRLPGTTSNLNCAETQLNPESEIDTKINPERIFGGARGTTDFVGGISDSNCGFMAADYNHLGISGKKAWFCFDRLICCMGAHIRAENGAHAYTTINQCKSRGEVFSDSGRITAKAMTISDLKWILHDRIGYFMLQKTPVLLENGLRHGSWSLVDADSGTDEPVEKEIFLLGIDHETAGDDYAYIIIPGADKELMESLSEPLCILSNTKDCQAVWQKVSRTVQAVFYQKGSVQYGKTTISTDSPCALMLTETEDDYALWVSDPEHTEKDITVTLTGEINDCITFRLEGGFRHNNLGRPACYTKSNGFLPFSGAKGDFQHE